MPAMAPPARAAKVAAKRQRLTRDERREQLLDVAADLIAEGGFEAVTMERVAEQAGVSKALPYAHFDNASDLLLALFIRELTDHGQRVIAAIEQSDDPTRAGIDAFFDTVEKRRIMYRVMLHPTSTPGPLRDFQLSSQTRNDSYFAKRWRRELGLPDSVARVAATMMLDSLGGTVRAWHQGYASRDEVERIFTIYTNAGLKALADDAMKDKDTADHGSRRTRARPRAR